MSAVAARLKTEMKPKIDELVELRDLSEPSADEIQRIDVLTGELKTMKDQYDKAIERHQKTIGVESMYADLNDPITAPRARFEGSTRGKEGQPEVKALSDYFIESRDYKSAAARDDRYNVIERVPTSALYPFLPEVKAAYIPGNLQYSGPNLRVISPTSPAMRYPLLDLLRTVPWNDLSVPYLPLTFTNNAAEVAYGTAKPESTNSGDLAFLLMKTVAHWKETARQILRYIPALRSAIEDELRTGVLAKMQTQVLNGPGTGITIKGILAQVTNTASGATLIPQIFDAIGKIETAGGVVDAILMNPSDYAALLALEYANNQFNVLLQNERFGQYRIIRVGAQAAGTATVGDFGGSTTLFVGEAANVQATEALGLKSNIVTMRAEMDAVVLVERPWLIYKCAGPLVTP